MKMLRGEDLISSRHLSMIPAMGQDRPQQATPDLFSTAPVGETSPPATKPVVSAEPERRHVLPKELPNAVKHLSDQGLARCGVSRRGKAARQSARRRSDRGICSE